MRLPIFLRSADLELEVLPRGASVRALRVRDRRGRVVDVALFPGDDAQAGAATGYLGASVGRCANRLAGGRVVVDGAEHRLSTNEGPTTLHGGRSGFDARVWSPDVVTRGRARLRLVSEDGDQGFPGRLVAVAEFTVRGPVVSLTYAATTDRPTIVNLTNHTYVNLSGEGSSTVLDHTLEVKASRYTPVGAGLIPTGRIAAVAGGPLDYRRPRLLRADVDDNLVLDRAGVGVREVATLRSPRTGVTLTLATDQPGLQVYAGNQLDGAVVGKGGARYGPNAGVALETQAFPDSPHHRGFPTVLLRPGQRYTSRTTWRFSPS